MARSKYFVFNGRQPKYFIKREGSVFLETWHGTPLKKLVFDMEELTSASPMYKRDVYIQSCSWDYLIAPNRFSAEIFRRCFMYDGTMLDTGYPRNDILHLNDAMKYGDIARLYLMADVLITDYSSVFFDFANLRRPMLFFTYDLEKYRSVLRGFYINIEEELPGPMLFTTEEIIAALRNLPDVEKIYREKYKLFYDKYCSWEDGNASRKVAERVFRL